MRIRTSTAVTSALSALAICLAASGCTNASEVEAGGPSGSGAATAASQPSVDLSSVAKDDRIAAMVPADVTGKGTLTNGAEGTYAPAEFIGVDGKTLVGFDMDIATAIGKVMGLRTTNQSSAFAQIIPSIGTKFDMGISGFTVTPERLKQVNMVTYMSDGWTYGVAKGNPKKVDPKNVCGTTIAVQTGTAQADDARKSADTCKAGGKKAVTVLSYDQMTSASQAVIGGKADMMYADSIIVNYAGMQSNGKLEQLGGKTNTDEKGVVLPKDDPKMAKAVQAALQKLIDDGTMKKIMTAWGAEGTMITTSQINPNE